MSSTGMIQVIAGTRQDGRPCDACNAKLVWYRTKANNKPHPFNADVQEHVQNGLLGPPAYILIDTKYSHFATCPEASRFRQKRAK